MAKGTAWTIIDIKWSPPVLLEYQVPCPLWKSSEKKQDLFIFIDIKCSSPALLEYQVFSPAILANQVPPHGKPI